MNWSDDSRQIPEPLGPPRPGAPEHPDRVYRMFKAAGREDASLVDRLATSMPPRRTWCGVGEPSGGPISGLALAGIARLPARARRMLLGPRQLRSICTAAAVGAKVFPRAPPVFRYLMPCMRFALGGKQIGPAFLRDPQTCKLLVRSSPAFGFLAPFDGTLLDFLPQPSHVSKRSRSLERRRPGVEPTRSNSKL